MSSGQGQLPPLTPEEGLRQMREMGKSYADSLARVRELAAAEQTKVDAMLTWSVGLMGAGLLGVHSIFGTCGVKGGALLWLTAPWLIGILLAVLGRVLAMHHRTADGLFFARKWGDLQPVLLDTSLSPEGLARALQDIIGDRTPAISAAQAHSRSWSRRLTFVFYLVHICFAIGVVLVVWRLRLC
jgi:hypothetical protein